MPTVTLPDAQELIRIAREAMAQVPAVPAGATERARKLAAERRRKAASRALDRFAPAIDEEIDTTAAAAFVGYADPGTIRTLRRRTRADGTRYWPEPDRKFSPSSDPLGRGGGSAVWKYRTIVIAQAEAPGKGRTTVPDGRPKWNEERRGKPRTWKRGDESDAE